MSIYTYYNRSSFNYFRSDHRFVIVQLVNKLKIQFILRLSYILFYRINVSSEFKKIQEAADLVDITFSCDGKQFGAHKLVLFACSPYFREILKVC